MTATVALEFARIGFLNMLAFRLRYYTGVITYLVNVTVYSFIWKALYSAGAPLGAVPLNEMLTYVGVGWMIRSLYFNNIDVELAQDILEGKIIMTMLRPAGVQATYVTRALGESGFRLVLLTIPVAVAISVFFPMLAPRTAGHAILFLLAVAASVLIVCFLNFLVGTLALSLTSILGLLRAKFWMQELLSGLLVPVAFFPEPMRSISAWLPFEHIGYSPMVIYLGRTTMPESLVRVGVALAWAALLAVAGHLLWTRLSRRITVHGG